MNELQRDALMLALLWLRTGDRTVESLCACGQLYQIAYAHSPLVRRARRYYEEALSIAPDCWLALREIGVLELVYFDQALEAVSWLQRSLAMNQDLETRLYLAKAAAMQGNREEAIRQIMWIETPSAHRANGADLDEYDAVLAEEQRQRALIAQARQEIDDGLWDPVEDDGINPV